MPEYASTEELKIKLCITIKSLLEIKSKWNYKNRNEEKEINKILTKYYKLYEQTFSWEESNIKDIKYLNSIINKWEKDKYKKFQEKITKISTEEGLEWLKDELSDQILLHFNESFFEEGVNLLRFWMMTMTQLEQSKLKEWNSNISLWNWKAKLWETKKRVKNEELDKREKLLRDSIWIDGKYGFKTRLNNARKNWNIKEVNKIELEATKKIMLELSKYPYQRIESNNWFKPSKVLEKKEIYCVWFAILWHTFLNELNIKHNWLDIPWHTCLEVIIWEKRYYFDPSFYNKIYEFKYWEKIWLYNDIIPIGIMFERKIIAKSWNPETVLYSSICNNQWVHFFELWDNKKAIEFYNKGIKTNRDSISLYINKWISIWKIWDHKKAIA